jgi:hypothetical protein
MGHGEGWQYLQAGRFIERAAATAALIGVFLPGGATASRDDIDHVDGVALLRSCSALEAYCRFYTAEVRPERVAEFLLLNVDFPRSVRFAAARLESAVLALARASGRGVGGRAERLAGRLHASLDYGQVDEILDEDPAAYLTGVARQCAQIHSTCRAPLAFGDHRAGDRREYAAGDGSRGCLRRLVGGARRPDQYERFEYSPLSTRVDSPIDEALRAKRGVCQDFSHIFIALARHLGVPTRYVSGYLFGDVSVADRSTDGATHAWAEALIPDAGWIGLDPTNNLMAGERHIRVAIGRDYADVPPTRGVYKGATAVRSELAVAVRISSVNAPHVIDAVPFTPWMSRDAGAPLPDSDVEQQQQ